MSPAVERVYKSHAGVVRRALRSFGVDAAALDDAVQDVFVVLVRRAGEFDARGTWTNWVWGIARRVARGYRRGAGRRERLHAALPRTSGVLGPDDELARRRAVEFLDDFVAALPPALLDVFVLAEIEGFTAPEIAQRTGANLNTIYARIRNVRRRFDAAIDAELAPRKTGAWWLLGAPWWTPAATTACVALTLGLAELAPIVEPVEPARAVEPPLARNDDMPAKDPVMPSKSHRFVAPIVAGVVATALVAPIAEAKPKARRAKAEERVEKSDQDADAAALRGNREGGLTYYDFENDTVEGATLHPEGQNVTSRPRGPMGSLLTLRGHFLPELIVMAMDV
jgi:RNA polymerase sigma-70 factor (ECF subfamily)